MSSSPSAPSALLDLASERFGGAVLIANDDFFAPKENLVKAAEPIWLEDEYTERGKWMDGWESRRRREPGDDWAIIRLGLPGVVRRVVVDTAFFTGNYPEHCSIEACAVDGYPLPAELADESRDDWTWVEILEKSPLEGDHKNEFEIEDAGRYTHLRLRIYPDGGVARLRVLGEPIVDPKRVRADSVIDLAALENGGRAVAWSDMFYGDASNMLRPGRGVNMGDGWETRRRRGPGNDWAVIKLTTEAVVDSVEVDTNHFKGNCPGSCTLEGLEHAGEWHDELLDADWTPLVSQTSLQPHTRHHLDAVENAAPVDFVRLQIYPDGGISRLRVHGRITAKGRERGQLRWFNSLQTNQAQRELLACCGSKSWASAMAEARPFESVSELLLSADALWAGVGETDRLEAFAAHPRIGQKKEGDDKFAKWSREEQSGATGPSANVKQELSRLNNAYFDKFGFIYIVFASGKSADEMLELLSTRVENDRATELDNAAAEQHKITRLRLEKLMRG